MECTQLQDLGIKEYLQQFNRKVAQQRIPIAGSFNLTNHCNLRCVHCYLDRKYDKGKELSTAAWHGIIDEITEAGCLYLLLTGGEPLLREDFADIYRHARTNGLIVTVFTNGTHINAEHIELFKEFPPRMVEISLYGATDATYERVTGVPGSYQLCRQGIQQLWEHRIPFGLKMILMTLNRHEFYDIKNIAEDYGVRFRFDAAIFPQFNGEKAPINLRVTPEEAVEKEFSDAQRFQQWQEFFERMERVTASDALYRCGAGLANFHITADGKLQPCLMAKEPQYDLLAGSFTTGWYEVIPRIRREKVRKDFVCRQCEKIALCGYCPAFFELENDAETVPSRYLCALGESRFNRLTKN